MPGPRDHRGGSRTGSAGPSEELKVDIEEGLNVPLLSGQDKEYHEAEETQSTAGQKSLKHVEPPSPFLDLFFFADKVSHILHAGGRGLPSSGVVCTCLVLCESWLSLFKTHEHFFWPWRSSPKIGNGFRFHHPHMSTHSCCVRMGK